MNKILISFLTIILLSAVVLAESINVDTEDATISIEDEKILVSHIQGPGIPPEEMPIEDERRLVSHIQGPGHFADINVSPEQIKTRMQERRQIHVETMSNIREKLQSGEELSISEKGVVLKKINNEIIEIKGERGSIIETKLQLNNEDNINSLQVKLNNGRNAEIKIMPETASERAIERLRLKNCNETNNCSIELKEVGIGNQTRVAYETKVFKTFKLFGLFKSQREVFTQIDAETGEEILTKKPWWSWMASEEE